MKKIYLFVSVFFFFFQHATQAQSIFFDITNERVVSHPTLGSSTAFDVMMYCDQSGTFHSRGQLYITYNTGRFGTTVNLNNNIDYVHGDLMDDQVNFLGMLVPYYNTINVIDNSESKVVFTWLSNFLNLLPTASAHTEVPTTPTLLYTIFIKIQNPAIPSNLNFDTQSMIGQQYYLTNVGGTPTEVPYGNGFLPVELLDFQADKADDQSVALSWATANEINNDHFVIEKGLSNGEFFPIGQVQGAGTTDEMQSYSFIDNTPMDVVNYYRLKQVDIDGSFHYSDVLHINFDLNEMRVYPSPTEGDVFVQYTGEMTGNANIRVTDISGKVVLQQQHQFTTSNEEVRLDFRSLAKGMYVVQVTKPDGEVENHRVVKLKP